mgnify:FL=1|tara:strand:- start:134 stop:436 length:303 start_codon:yes stop_codon:yes gene_type:complete
MKEYKATDPEMVQAQKDLAKMSNLSDRVITNDDDLFKELATIQRKLCQISEFKSNFLQRYEDILEEQHNLETQLCIFQHEMLHSFELCFRYYKTKKKGFK